MKNKRILYLLFILIISITACNRSKQQGSKNRYPTIGSIKMMDAEAKDIIDEDAYIEVLDSGFVWTEGPLWVASDSMLLFSDVPANTVYKWKEGKKSEIYLKPSGYEGQKLQGKEPGSNGLILNAEGKLTLAQHGNHQIAYMDSPLNSPVPRFVTLAKTYEGKRLNSPNDVIQDREGNYYFTDPIYGLSKPEDQELLYTGIYKLAQDGTLSLLVDSVVAPNGLALTNDERFLLVSNSYRTKPYLYEFELGSDSIIGGRIVYDFSSEMIDDGDVPDGLKVDKKGNIFISGPQGLWILNKEYKPIAQLVLPHAISNCWLANNDQTLYITGSDKVLRLKLNSQKE